MRNHPNGINRDTLISSASSYNGVSPRNAQQGNFAREIRPTSAHYFESPREESYFFRFDSHSQPFEFRSPREAGKCNIKFFILINFHS